MIDAQAQSNLLMIKGIISELPQDSKLKVIECSADLKAVMAKYGDEGQIALALIGAEMSV